MRSLHRGANCFGKMKQSLLYEADVLLIKERLSVCFKLGWQVAGKLGKNKKFIIGTS